MPKNYCPPHICHDVLTHPHRSSSFSLLLLSVAGCCLILKYLNMSLVSHWLARTSCHAGWSTVVWTIIYTVANNKYTKQAHTDHIHTFYIIFVVTIQSFSCLFYFPLDLLSRGLPFFKTPLVPNMHFLCYENFWVWYSFFYPLLFI